MGPSTLLPSPRQGQAQGEKRGLQGSVSPLLWADPT